MACFLFINISQETEKPLQGTLLVVVVLSDAEHA